MNLILFLFLAMAPLAPVNDIAEINQLKEEAREAYINGDYEAAVVKYNTLINTYGIADDEVRLNLAHAQYKNKDLEGAMNNYSQLLASNEAHIRSSASNQMGLISHQQKKLEESLAHFKDALKADPANDEARYNYSVVKKELDKQQKQQENQKDKDKKQQQQDKDKKQQEQNKENKEQGDGQEEEEKKEEGKGEEKKEEEEKNGQQEKQEEQKPGQQGQQKEEQQGEEQEDTEQMPQSTAERLEEMSIPKEKAQMILEAMKNNEIQYLQQNQRKSRSKADSDKPYW